MSRNPRAATTRLLELMEEGSISAETIVNACMNYMSEVEVEDMAESEGFWDADEDEEEEIEDDDSYDEYDDNESDHFVNDDDSYLDQHDEE